MLDMLAEVYEVFGLTYKLALSTRPEGYLGTLEMWDRAEAALTDALNNTGLDWEVRHAINAAMQHVSRGVHRGSGTALPLCRSGEIKRAAGGRCTWYLHVCICWQETQAPGSGPGTCRLLRSMCMLAAQPRRRRLLRAQD